MYHYRAIADSHQDAELLRLWAEYERLRRCIATAGRLSDEQCDMLGGKISEIEFAIHETPAHTLAGLAVKAKLAAEYSPPLDPDGPCLEDILLNLAEEVQRLAAIDFEMIRTQASSCERSFSA